MTEAPYTEDYKFEPETKLFSTGGVGMTEMKRINPGSITLQEYVCEPCSEKICEIQKNFILIGGSKNVSCNYCGEKHDWMLANYFPASVGVVCE